MKPEEIKKLAEHLAENATHCFTQSWEGTVRVDDVDGLAEEIANFLEEDKNPRGFEKKWTNKINEFMELYGYMGPAIGQELRDALAKIQFCLGVATRVYSEEQQKEEETLEFCKPCLEKHTDSPPPCAKIDGNSVCDGKGNAEPTS